MTQQVRVNFLNWQPDKEPLGNEGLVTADNLLHDTEGYKELRIQSAGAFSTTTANTFNGTHIVDAQIKPLLNSNTLGMASITDVTGSGTTVALNVGVVGDQLSFTSTTTGTLSSLGAVKLLSFSVSELEDRAVLVATAEAELQGGTVTSLNLSLIGSYTLS